MKGYRVVAVFVMDNHFEEDLQVGMFDLVIKNIRHSVAEQVITHTVHVILFWFSPKAVSFRMSMVILWLSWKTLSETKYTLRTDPSTVSYLDISKLILATSR